MGREGILSALNAGVDTIEHGDGLDDETIDLMVKRGVYWCPTIFVGVYVAPGLRFSYTQAKGRTSFDKKALAGAKLGNYWKYRVGDWRIVCDIQDGRIVVRVLRIGNRREVYR